MSNVYENTGMTPDEHSQNTIAREVTLTPHSIHCTIREGKKLVRAVYSFDSPDLDDDIFTYQKGDIMEVIEEDGEWLRVKKVGTVEEGDVHTCHFAVEESLESFDWFHGDISRKEAESVLKSFNEKGTFLVRGSESNQGSYALSILDDDMEKGRVAKHFRITNTTGRGHCYIFPADKFESLPSLVEKYSKTREQRLPCSLSKPCRRKRPQVWDLSRLTRDTWEIPREEIKLLNEIGFGNYGVVHKGLWKERTEVAVKKMKEGSMDKEKFLGEATTMKKLRHPKLVTLYGVCTLAEPIYIITELMPKGDLQHYLRDAKSTDITDDWIINIACQVSDGMWYIEKEDYIHRDLAARNILMEDDDSVKIGDFGLARLTLESIYQGSEGDKNPVKWTAPEALKDHKYTIKSDVWSFGILLVELTSNGAVPYPDKTRRQVEQMIERGSRHSQPENCSNDLYALMSTCWESEPSARPSFETLNSELLKLNDQST